MTLRSPIDVIVGLISDGDGRWLVNRRPEGKPLAGSWEFPGGKLQPGETPLEALQRELDEELGIEVLDAEPLLTLMHEYTDKTVRLNVWRVRRYGGDVAARESQPLRWVTASECGNLPLLEADRPIVACLERLAAEPARA